MYCEKQMLNNVDVLHIHKFNSLSEFCEYITTTPTNNLFTNKSLSSQVVDYEWTQTHDFNEAIGLLKNGWSTMAKELETKLKANKSKMQHETHRKNYFDVVGFQASVPRYLQGIPTNMVNQRAVIQKQKVITFNKDISYGGSVKAEEIVENSVKALSIIQQIESQGIRCNLNLILGVYKGNEYHQLKIKLKGANERLNVSKLAFPLVHPSMLRRLYLRFVEVEPTFKHRGFIDGYGTPMENKRLQCKGEYLLPRFIKDAEEFVNNLNKC